MFVRTVAEAALMACSPDYVLLRPVLVEFRRRYPRREGLHDGCPPSTRDGDVRARCKPVLRDLHIEVPAAFASEQVGDPASPPLAGLPATGNERSITG
jgi:hypothetical protein